MSDTGTQDLTGRLQLLERTLERERAARRAAEVLLEEKATELFTAKRQLEVQYEHLQNVLSAMTDGVILADHDGVVTNVNPAMERMLGILSDDVAGRRAEDLIDFSSGSMAELFEAAKDEIHHYIEAMVLTANRASHPVSLAVAAVGDGTRPEQGWVISVHDIAHRKLREAQLQQLSNAVEQIADAVLITNRDGVIEYANPAFERITGYALHEVIGEQPSFLKSGWQDEAFYHNLWDTILRGDVYRDELVDRRKDGSEVYVEKTITPLRDPSGEITHFVSSDRDITSRRLAEAQLQESEQRFRNLVEQAGDAFFVHDLEGRIVDVNQQACNSLGYEREELVGLDVWDIEDGLDAVVLKQKWRQMPVGAPTNLAGFHRRKDGTTLPIEARVAKFEQGGRMLLLALVRDVTERRQLESQVVQAEKMAGLGQLAAGVAHEINNPVGYVISNLQSLEEYMQIVCELLGQMQALRQLESSPDAVARQQVMENIERISTKGNIQYILEDLDGLLTDSLDGANRVRDIVQNLRSFARSDDDKMQDADLNEGIEATLRVVSNELKYKADVDKQLSELPLVRCHPGQLNQVVMNMLVNAAHSIEQKGRITISTMADSDNVIVRISDTGSGIGKEHLGRIFDPFFTTKEVGSGTGLGLSISHGIIDRHGGTIDVDTEVGKGTTFTITLPIKGPKGDS